MNYIFRECNENEVMALTKMSEAAFNTPSDKEFGGSDGGPTGYDISAICFTFFIFCN